MVNFVSCQVSAVIKSSAHPVRNWENDKYLNGILDLTAHQEAGVAKIKAHPAKSVVFANEKHCWVCPSSFENKGIPKDKNLWARKVIFLKVNTSYSYASFRSSIVFKLVGYSRVPQKLFTQ